MTRPTKAAATTTQVTVAVAAKATGYGVDVIRGIVPSCPSAPRAAVVVFGSTRGYDEAVVEERAWRRMVEFDVAAVAHQLSSTLWIIALMSGAIDNVVTF